MKNILALLITLLAFQQLSSQSPSPQEDNNEIYNSNGVEFKPEFPGGISAFYKYIAENFNAPTAKEFKGGKLFVAFTVEIDGRLTDIKVVKEIGFGTTEETIRLLKASKAWTPAEQNGKRVRCSFMLPVTLGSNN